MHATEFLKMSSNINQSYYDHTGRNPIKEMHNKFFNSLYFLSNEVSMLKFSIVFNDANIAKKNLLERNLQRNGKCICFTLSLSRHTPFFSNRNNSPIH